jgi:uncharacterized protein YcfJ
MVTFFTAQTPFVRATEQTRSAGSNILQPIGRRHAPVFAIRLSHQEITMNTTAKRSSPMLRLTALATLAVAGLAGCAAPYPVYEQPVAQPAPVYQYPSQYPQAQQQQERRDYRRRNQETLYEAPVTSVRAVVGPSTAQRCWIEREEVVQQPQRNIPGAIAGAVIGGILGHQIGNGSGRDPGQQRPARVLGRDLHLQWHRPPRADDDAARPDHPCQRQWRTPRLTTRLF